MHKLAEKMADCLKAKVEGMGIDNIEGAALEELGKWVDIIKDIACYDKDMRIIKAMDEAEENEEKMKYIEEYEDYPEMEMRRGYRGQPRDSRGRYMSRRRMGYEEPPYWHMTPEMYRRMPMEWERDMDREGLGRMYYTEGGNMSGDSTGGTRGYSERGEGGQYSSRMQRDSREGRSGMMRRGYMEAKEQGKEKQEKMKELENYMKELSSDVTEMISDASPEEKNMLKAKMQTLLTKIQ